VLSICINIASKERFLPGQLWQAGAPAPGRITCSDTVQLLLQLMMLVPQSFIQKLFIQIDLWKRVRALIVLVII